MCAGSFTQYVWNEHLGYVDASKAPRCLSTYLARIAHLPRLPFAYSLLSRAFPAATLASISHQTLGPIPSDPIDLIIQSYASRFFLRDVPKSTETQGPRLRSDRSDASIMLGLVMALLNKKPARVKRIYTLE